MKSVAITKYGTIKLNSFRPLCWNQLGVQAINKYDFPPFIDASCRREPDFENPSPSITALCRQGQFAPHLKEGDVVIYMTVDGIFPPFKTNHHLVAILHVEEVYETHDFGKIDYLRRRLPIPSNCMVPGNPPFDFDMTAGNFDTKSQLRRFLAHPEGTRKQIGEKLIEIWDDSYLAKSKTWKCFVRTNPIFLNLVNPPQILRMDFDRIFGKLPNTRTPKILKESEFLDLGTLIGLKIELGK